jgi:DNA invertase Pin-like site-specific DNA recombinase
MTIEALEALKPTRAAQYVRMSTDKQQYSPLNQMAAIAAYAARRNLILVRTYADEGRSGLDLNGRSALQSLLRDVQNGQADYDVILVYDISRWGRFQDADESAYYEFICKEAGIKVHYCAEEFENDGSLAATILKNMKRVMAGEYSRELSTKVFVAQCRGASMGFCQGGRAGYGFRRLLLDQHGSPKDVLGDYQRKSLQTDRVVLAPGPSSEIRVIRRIFTDFVVKKKTRTQVAEGLNARGIPNALGKPWTMQTINNILKNEKYIGHLVFNRTSFKLQNVHVRNAPEMWVRRNNAFRPIVDPKLFAKAQRRLSELAHSRKVSDKELLARLKTLWRKKGRLTCSIINGAKTVPKVNIYATRFGSITNAYKRIGFIPSRRYEFAATGAKIDDIICSAARHVIADVERRSGNASFLRELYLLTINSNVTVVICIAWAVADGVVAGKRLRRWDVRKIRYRTSDLILLIRMNATNSNIQDYFLVPTAHLALTKDRKKLRISDRVFGSFRHETLDAMLQALHGRLRSRALARTVMLGNPASGRD